MDQARLAVEGQQLFIAQNIGDARIDAPENVELAVDQFLTEGDELLLVDRRLLVGQDEEADAVIAHQRLDFVRRPSSGRGFDSRARTSTGCRSCR